MTHQCIRIRIKAFDNKVIDNACATIIDIIQKNGSIYVGPVPMPTRIKKFCVNKSTFVNSRAKEQFEMRTHNRLIDIVQYTPKTIEALSGIDLPAGVDLEIKMLNSKE